MYLVILIYTINLSEDWFSYFWGNIFHNYDNHIDISQLIFARNYSACFYMIEDIIAKKLNIWSLFFPIFLNIIITFTL